MRERPVTAAMMLLEGVAILAGFFGPVWILHASVISFHVQETPLSLALAFLTVQAIAILLQLVASCGLKWIREVGAVRSGTATATLQRELALHAVGENRIEALRRLERRRSRDFDRSMASFLSLVNGQERHALSALARDLQLVQRWERRARGGDERDRKLAVDCLGLLEGRPSEGALWRLAQRSAPLVEAAACRLLARTVDPESAARLLGLSLGKPYLVRVLLAGELRRHAPTLCEKTIPTEVARADERRIIAALELAGSWHNTLHLPDWPVLMAHSSPAVRAAALRVIPLNMDAQDVEPYVLEALQSYDLQLRESALMAVCQLRIGSTLPLLAHVASGDSGELARLACHALSSLEPEGIECLRTILLEGPPRAAARAAETLAERLRPSLSLEFA